MKVVVNVLMKHSLFLTNILLSDELLKDIKLLPEQEKRDRYNTLEKYLAIKPIDKVCVLYGLKGTGKKTLLGQCVLSMSVEDIKKTAYIKLTSDDTMSNVFNDLDLLYKNGIRYVFMEEISSVKDFITLSATLSDIYAAKGMKIILSGTDSFSFCLAEKDELYDRAYNIRTTYIPFKEWSRLFKGDDIDKYIKTGGTLYHTDSSFTDNESAQRYIDTAIVNNLYNSLANCDDRDRFKHLHSLYESGKLKAAVRDVIQDMNYRFILDVLKRIADIKEINQIMESLNQRRTEYSISSIAEIQVNEIKEYLKELDMISYVTVEETIPEFKLYDEIVFTQPGMRYCQAQAFVHSLMKDSLFNEQSEPVKSHVSERILSEVKGRMLEDIVLMETTKKLNPKQYKVFKFMTAGGEWDMVIYDCERIVCGIYKIIHSDKVDKNQYTHLTDDKECTLMERKFGDIVSKTVLYRGENLITESGIQYCNVEEYLKETIYDFSLQETQKNVSMNNDIQML